MGGQVDYHPEGKEIGTVKIQLNTGYINDTLFQSLPQQFHVHVSHSQSILHLPAGAISLAENVHDSNQAFRLGDFAWGVQFHPEYDANIMRSYILEQAEELKLKGQDVSALLDAVRATPHAAQVLQDFARVVERA
jgi:GMP synthase (glutamine-hydrolysing)